MSIRTESIKRIIRIEGRVPEVTTVWLAPADEGKAFHCQSCGAFMFNRQHRIVAIIQDDASHALQTCPLELQCHKCGHTYHVNIW